MDFKTGSKELSRGEAGGKRGRGVGGGGEVRIVLFLPNHLFFYLVFLSIFSSPAIYVSVLF